MDNIKLLDASKYHKQRGQITLKWKGVTIASGEGYLSRTANITDDDHYTVELAQKTLAYSAIDQLDFQLDLEFVQVSTYAIALATMSDISALTQNAIANGTTELFEDITDEQVIPLNCFGATNVVVTDEDDTVYVEGVDYNVTDEVYKKSFVNPLPPMYGKSAKVAFSAPKLEGKVLYLGSNASIEMEVEFHESTLPGVDAETHIYNRVQLRPDQVDYTGTSSDPRSVKTKGKLLPDTSKPAGQQLGHVIYGMKAAA